MEDLYQAEQAVEDAKTPTQAANAWYALNVVADKVAQKLTQASGDDHARCSVAAENASAAGVLIFWAEICRQWAAQPTGYLIYSRSFSPAASTLRKHGGMAQARAFD